MIETAWPGLTVFACGVGEIHPYDRKNAGLFRGEETFSPDVTGWQCWSKPSPEPQLDATFRSLLIESIGCEAGAIAGLVHQLAESICLSLVEAPLLVAILRAGVPVGTLLARCLARRLGQPVPLVAISLFQGLGWDEDALATALSAHPGRPVWFVDGWTSSGGVAQELQASYQRWMANGRPDFTAGAGPQLAVLCDPNGFATACPTRSDRFIPSACFTAPETLGFSRGFVTGYPGMFKVYQFPPHLIQPACLSAWMAIHDAIPIPPAPDLPRPAPPSSSSGWRFHINEVVRAIINRHPQEILLRDDQATAMETLAPVLYLCQLRGIPVRYRQSEVAQWGSIAAARMQI